MTSFLDILTRLWYNDLAVEEQHFFQIAKITKNSRQNLVA